MVPSLRSANLSALKKRWEQPSAPPPAQPAARSRPLAAPRPAPGPLRQASQDEGGMDGDGLTREGPEIPEEQVPSSPLGSYEKPRVPLNNLKMKFERGDGAPSTVRTAALISTSLFHTQDLLH